MTSKEMKERTRKKGKEEGERKKGECSSFIRTPGVEPGSPHYIQFTETP
jgi:hypothetical protein